MFEPFLHLEGWISLLTLSAMEIVLGIDNIVFISVLVQRLPAARVDPLAAVEELQLKHLLKRAMDRLPGRCAELLTKLYLVEEQPDYDSLSRELGIPRGSLGPTRGRCLEKLKKLYEKG